MLKLGAKDTFLPELYIKISEEYFFVMGLAHIIYVLDFSVEGISDRINLFFRRGISTKKTDVIKFCPDMDCDFSFSLALNLCSRHD